MVDEKKFFLLDGYVLVYWVYFVFINCLLINFKGVNILAVMGFIWMFWDFMCDQKLIYIVVVFDLFIFIFWYEMYEFYKANWEEQLEDIVVVILYIEVIVKVFNIFIVIVDGYEVDDVIGILAKQAEKEGFKVYMVMLDKDFGQFVFDNVFLYKFFCQGNGVDIMGVLEIFKKWDVEWVEQVIDMLGLQGDVVDNILGVLGIGLKIVFKFLV